MRTLSAEVTAADTVKKSHDSTAVWVTISRAPRSEKAIIGKTSRRVYLAS